MTLMTLVAPASYCEPGLRPATPYSGQIVAKGWEAPLYQQQTNLYVYISKQYHC